MQQQATPSGWWAKVHPSAEVMAHHLALHLPACPQPPPFLVVTTCPCGQATAVVCWACCTVLLVSAGNPRCSHAIHATGGEAV
jgi:hypothetical protein